MRNIVRFLGCLAVVALVMGLSAICWANNLLVNPGFESSFNAWTDLYGDPSWLSTGPVHTGNYAAAKTIGVIPTQDYWSQIYQEVDYPANQAVYVTMWMKTGISPQANAKAGILVNFLDSAGNIIGESLQKDMGGEADWRNLYVSGITPAGTARVRLSGYVWALDGDTFASGGNAYFDDAVVSSDYIAAPPLAMSLLNPGFENGLNDWTDLFGQPSWLSTTIVHSGNYAAAKTISDVTTQAYWSQLYQEMSAAPGRNFSARMWVKTNFVPTSSARAGVRVQFYNSAGIMVGPPFSSAVLSGQNEWRRLMVSGVIPARAVKTRVNAFIYAAMGDLSAVGGIAYYDDTYAGRPLVIGSDDVDIEEEALEE